MEKQRRQSYLFAMQLDQEHQLARQAFSVSPKEVDEEESRAKEIAAGMEQLRVIMVKVKVEHAFKYFKRRKITYSQAKGMTAREFAALGLKDQDAIRLANTLSYANAVKISYDAVGASSPPPGADGSSPPVLFPDDPVARLRFQYGYTDKVRQAGPNAPSPHTRRLSAMGRDLLGVFDQTMKASNGGRS